MYRNDLCNFKNIDGAKYFLQRLLIFPEGRVCRFFDQNRTLKVARVSTHCSKNGKILCNIKFIDSKDKNQHFSKDSCHKLHIFLDFKYCETTVNCPTSLGAI